MNSERLSFWFKVTQQCRDLPCALSCPLGQEAEMWVSEAEQIGGAYSWQSRGGLWALDSPYREAIMGMEGLKWGYPKLDPAVPLCSPSPAPHPCSSFSSISTAWGQARLTWKHVRERIFTAGSSPPKNRAERDGSCRPCASGEGASSQDPTPRNPSLWRLSLGQRQPQGTHNCRGC